MPEISEYPYTDPAVLIEMAKTEDTGRAAAEDSAWAYYNGDMRRPLKVRADQPDDNVILGMVAKMVDQGISMLVGEMPHFDTDEAKQTEEEDRIAEVLRISRGPILMHNLALYGALSGHVFAKLGAVAEGETITDLRLYAVRPKLITPYWSPGDFSDVRCYRIQWKAGQDIHRQDIIHGSLLDGVNLAPDQWLIRDLFAERGAKWEETGAMVWGWDFPPIVDWQNLPNPTGFFGRSDLSNPEINDRANFVASNILRIIKYHAHPRTIVTGANAAQVQDTAVDQMWTIPVENANVFNLEMQSDLSSSMAMLSALQAAFYAEHRAVDMTSLKDKLGQLTNFGLRSLFRDALDKLSTKRSLYGDGLTELCRRILVLSNMDAATPVIHWPAALQFNGLEEMQEIQMEMSLGILSKETAAKERGRDWEQEQERLEMERDSETNFGAELLRSFERGG